MLCHNSGKSCTVWGRQGHGNSFFGTRGQLQPFQSMQSWWCSDSKDVRAGGPFWLEAKELTHHSLQGDTALGRSDQKTMHSHWVGPPAEAKLLISILLFGIGQSFHDTDLLHVANFYYRAAMVSPSILELRTYKNKNTSSILTSYVSLKTVSTLRQT